MISYKFSRKEIIKRWNSGKFWSAKEIQELFLAIIPSKPKNLPHCTGCTDLRSEGTHQGDTIEHWDKMHPTPLPKECKHELPEKFDLYKYNSISTLELDMITKIQQIIDWINKQ